ncbi:hypothetical protein Tco_0689492 [Tanacetum coccineum]
MAESSNPTQIPSQPELIQKEEPSTSQDRLKKAFIRAQVQYKEYPFEFWYTAKTLEDSKIWVSTPTGGIRGEISVTTFRNTIRANYLSHSNKYAKTPSLAIVRPWFSLIRYNREIRAKEYMMLAYENDELTINPTQVFSVHNWALKPNQPEGPSFTDHMLAICNAEEPMESKAPNTSSQAKKKEDQQAAGGPTSLGVTGEEGGDPQLSSGMPAFIHNKPVYSASFIIHSESTLGCDASADSTAKVDPEIPDPNDSIPQQQEVDKYEDTHATSHEEIKDSSNLKLEQQKEKVEAEVAFLKAQPSYPNVTQLTELLVTSLKPKLSNLLASRDFCSFMPAELKELPSKIIELSGEIKDLKKHSSLHYQVKSLQFKTLDALPGLLNKVTNTLNKFAHIIENASKKARDNDVPSARQGIPSPAKGEKNNQAIISQLFQRKFAKDVEKANLKQQPTTPPTTSFQSPFFPSLSPPRSTPQTEGELINKDKGKEAMSSKDAEEEETKSDSENEYANLTDSKKKKLKKFDFVTEGGEQFHFTAEEIKNQKRIKESLKADLAKQEVEKVKNELVDLMGIDVVTKYYKDKLLYDKYCDKMMNKRKSSKTTNCDVLTKKGPITLKVYREDETVEVIPNFKAKQDPLDELNDLANKKRKRDDNFHDYFRHDLITIEDLIDFSNEMMYTVQEVFFRFHQGPDLNDHARTFSSFLLAKVDERNRNPLKQMRLIKKLRQ